MLPFLPRQRLNRGFKPPRGGGAISNCPTIEKRNRAQRPLPGSRVCVISWLLLRAKRAQGACTNPRRPVKMQLLRAGATWKGA